MTIRAEDVCAVVVTRGDVDLTGIRASLSMLGETVVWDNSVEDDVSVYGRYAAIERTGKPVILVQDDDVLLPASTTRRLLEAYEPGRLVANMPREHQRRYPDSALVGFGAVFDRDLPAEAFERLFPEPFTPGGEWWNYRMNRPGLVFEIAHSSIFHRTCDVVFSALTPRTIVDLPYVELAHARAPNRMYLQPGHTVERQRMLALAREVRDRVRA